MARSLLAQLPWWRDVRFWGSYPLAAAMIAAGFWGIYYESFVLGKYVCFHMFWGIAFLIIAGGMLYFNTTRLRRFNELMGDASVSRFLEHRKELEELSRQLPNPQRRAFKTRLAEATGRRR